MASVHAIPVSKTSHFDSVSVFNQQRLQAIYNSADKAKWSYLIADKIVFKQGDEHCIKLNMPSPEQLIMWLEKLITCGQCANICVVQVATFYQQSLGSGSFIGSDESTISVPHLNDC